jgi:hypothetical protein
MKKNKMMRLASGLLVTTLLTTSIISGTFAKYTTQDSASDTARVAKWGVVLTVEGDLYGANYLNGDQTDANTKTASTSNISVEGKQISPENVVAPGTKNDGTGFYFDIKGQPEVTTKVDATITTQNVFLAKGNYGVMVNVDDIVTEENYASLYEDLYYYLDGVFTHVDVDDVEGGPGAYMGDGLVYYKLQDAAEVTDDYYYPVVYTLTGASANSTSYTGDYKVDTLSNLASAIANTIKGNTGSSSTSTDGKKITTITATQTLATNTELAQALQLSGENITWEWAYDGVNDGADTILGNLIAQRVQTKKSTAADDGSTSELDDAKTAIEAWEKAIKGANKIIFDQKQVDAIAKIVDAQEQYETEQAGYTLDPSDANAQAVAQAKKSVEDAKEEYKTLTSYTIVINDAKHANETLEGQKQIVQNETSGMIILMKAALNASGQADEADNYTLTISSLSDAENVLKAAQEGYNTASAISSSMKFGGIVVKLQSNNTTYAAPTEYTDYCLDTQFSIAITATQVD